MIQSHSAHSFRHNFKWMYQQVHRQSPHNAARSEKRTLKGMWLGPKPRPPLPGGGSNEPNPNPDDIWKPQ